jgi:hypothetical protein
MEGLDSYFYVIMSLSALRAGSTHSFDLSVINPFKSQRSQ